MANPVESSKQKLLVLASTYPRWVNDHEPGFVHELSKRLVKRFDVVVLCPHAHGAKRSESFDGVTVKRFRYAPSALETLVNDGGIVTNLKRHRWKSILLPFFFLGMLWSTFRLIRQYSPDVIHAHWLIPQGMILFLLRCLGVRVPPFVVTSHGADLFALRSKPFLWLKRKVALSASEITVVSRAMVDEMRELGVPEDRVSVRSMGVDLHNRFTPRCDSSGGQELRVLSVGRLVEKKGTRYLVEATPAILQEFPAARIQVIGFGPQLAELEHLAAKLGVEKNIEFLGPKSQQDVADYIRSSSVFVAPFVEAQGGDQEGLGLVLVEALGCGCPVVVTDIPAARDVTENAAGVCVVGQRSVTELAEAINRVLSNNLCFREGARKSRETMIQKFDWEAVAESYARILASTIA